MVCAFVIVVLIRNITTRVCMGRCLIICHIIRVRTRVILIRRIVIRNTSSIDANIRNVIRPNRFYHSGYQLP